MGTAVLSISHNKNLKVYDLNRMAKQRDEIRVLNEFQLFSWNLKLNYETMIKESFEVPLYEGLRINTSILDPLPARRYHCYLNNMYMGKDMLNRCSLIVVIDDRGSACR